MIGSVRVNHHDVEFFIGSIEWSIIISTIPHYYVCFFFCFTNNSFVIYTGINYTAHLDMWFVLFHFFNCAVVFLQIFQFSKSLNFLFYQVAIRHRMTYRSNFQSFGFEYFYHLTSCLTFPTTCSGCANCYQGFGCFYTGIIQTHKFEICSCGVHIRTNIHNSFVGNITVSKNNFVNIMFFDKIDDLFFCMNGDTVRIELSSYFCRIFSSIDIGNLCSCKGNYIIIFIIAIV